jgi:hypothetical protein
MTAVEFLVEKMDIKNPNWLKEEIEQAKQMEKQQQGYSEEDLMESFIDGYKFRAEASNLIFDNASRMYAIHIFNENFKNK